MSFKTSLALLFFAFPALMFHALSEIQVEQAASPFGALSATEIDMIAVSGKAGNVIISQGQSQWTVNGAGPNEIDRAALKSFILKILNVPFEALTLDLQRDGRNEGEYGFNTPAAAVSFSSYGAGQKTIQFGGLNRYLAKRYAKVQGSPGVFLVSNDIYELLAGGIDTLRSRTPFDFKEEELRSITISRKDGELLLQRNESSNLTGNNDWRIAKPFAAGADLQAITWLIRHLRSLRTESFLNAAAGCEGRGLEDLRLTFHFSAKSSSVPLVARFTAASRNSDKSCVEHSGYSVPFIISGISAKTIGMLGSYLSKPLLIDTAEHILHIEVQRDREKAYTLTRDESGGWLVDGVPGDEPFILEFLESLESFAPLVFVDEGGLSAYKDPASASLKVVSRAQDSGVVTRSISLLSKAKLQDGQTRYRVSAEGIPSQFLLDAGTVKRIFPSKEVLLKVNGEG